MKAEALSENRAETNSLLLLRFLVSKLTAHKRHKDLDVFQFIARHGEHVTIKDNEVSKLAGFERTFAFLFETDVSAVSRVECERFANAEALLRRQDFTGSEFAPNHSRPHAPPRGHRGNGNIRSGSR